MYAGFVELSLPIPSEMPHFIRDMTRKEKHEMQFLEWKETYNIGVKEIDIQHRGLFDLISKLSKTKHLYHNDKFFFATLNTLMKYAEIHFSTEERYMREAQYPKLAEHKQEHTEFIVEVIKLLQAIEKKELDIHQKILNFLKDWYVSYFRYGSRL